MREPRHRPQRYQLADDLPLSEEMISSGRGTGAFPATGVSTGSTTRSTDVESNVILRGEEGPKMSKVVFKGKGKGARARGKLKGKGKT